MWMEYHNDYTVFAHSAISFTQTQVLLLSYKMKQTRIAAWRETTFHFPPFSPFWSREFGEDWRGWSVSYEVYAVCVTLQSPLGLIFFWRNILTVKQMVDLKTEPVSLILENHSLSKYRGHSNLQRWPNKMIRCGCHDTWAYMVSFFDIFRPWKKLGHISQTLGWKKQLRPRQKFDRRTKDVTGCGESSGERNMGR